MDALACGLWRPPACPSLIPALARKGYRMHNRLCVRVHVHVRVFVCEKVTFGGGTMKPDETAVSGR